MNYIYDLYCNFFQVDYFYDFYEWNKSDSIFLVEKIPVFCIHSLQLNDVTDHVIQVSKDFLKNIYRKTITEKGVLSYCCLVTDFNRVVALKFQEDGLLIERSSLLLDEELAVIDECIDFTVNDFSYTIVKKGKNLDFLTRYERSIQNYLLNELEKMYELNIYDEIEYLYHEIFSDYRDVKDMYHILINNIKNNFTKKYQKLYKIVMMIPIKDYCR